MSRLARVVLCLVACVTAAPCPAAERTTPPADSAPATPPNNPFGAHLFIQDACSDENLETHLTWARALVGPRGYAKGFFYNIDVATDGPREDWVRFMKAVYRFDLIPVLRLGGTWAEGSWVEAPGDPDGGYARIARAVRSVVEGLPREPGTNIYIEIWNEPNLVVEWSRQPDPDEYARFYVACYRAIRSIGDERIRVAPGALSPGGDYDNLDFVDAMCAVPGFVDCLDYWCTHSYPFYRPETNAHDGAVEPNPFTIDCYLAEFERLERHGVDTSRLRVIISEGGYSTGHGGRDFPMPDRDVQADFMMRAFRDYWSAWPEILAVTPYYFANPFGEMGDTTWVYPDSGTDRSGRPTKPTPQYTAVAELAKPTSDYGTISGKILDAETGLPVPFGMAARAEDSCRACATSAGAYMITGIRRFSQPFDVYALGPYHATRSVGGVEVAPGRNTVVDFRLPAVERGSVRGRVVDSVTREALADASIVVGGRFEARTDDWGEFAVADVNPGTYDVAISAEGHYSHAEPGVSVEPGKAPRLPVALGPGGPPAGRNLVGNPSFEGPSVESRPGLARGWAAVGDGRCVLGEAPYNGRQCQGIEPRGAPSSVVSWTGYSDVGPGGSYAVRCYVRTEGLSGRATLLAQLHDNPGYAVGEPAESQSLRGDAGWTLLSLTVPGLPEAGRLELILRAEGDSGVAWFDEAYIGRIEQ